MKSVVSVCVSLSALLGDFSAGALPAADAIAKEPAPIPHATEYRDVRYLPDWRYSGDSSPKRDAQMWMDIVVPDDGAATHPVLFVVHGGGWSAGSKNQGIYRDIMGYFVKRGFVCVGFDYIMRPRGMFPQVFWDYADAARFMRMHAEKYQVDPTRFGAIGLSAGGWLISSAGHGTGDIVCLDHQQSKHLGELWDRNWLVGKENDAATFACPMVSPEPYYGDTYGKFQAISYDFSFRTHLGSGNSPACNRWMGQGGKMKDHVQAVIDQQRFDYSETVLTHSSLRGRGVHVPPLFSSIQKDGSDKAEAVSIDGKRKVQAIERIHEFFEDQFTKNPRTPAPEIRPGVRYFIKQTLARFLMPTQECEIRYQVTPLARTKGKPWSDLHPPIAPGEAEQWTLYTEPFTVSETCLVRAVATSPGKRPSTVAEAHFFEGLSTPVVTSPAGKQLPPGQTGKPYTVPFQADAADVDWFLAGDLVPYRGRNDMGYTYPNNMVMDYRTGVWKGVPTNPGKYWIQIWVKRAGGTLAAHRDYTWTVTGQDLSGDAAQTTVKEDPHVEFVYFPSERTWPASQIVAELNRQGVAVIAQRDDQGTLLLVEDADREEAKRVITRYLESIKYKGVVQWQSPR